MRTRLPITAGVSLKPEYFDEALATADSELFFEIHPENYFIDGGPRLRGLQAIAERHAVSLHGIGASLGGVDPVPIEHLDSLKHLAEMLEPASISEHAAWSAAGNRYYANLLPLPWTRDALDRLVSHIDQMQTALKRTILIENPASYVTFVNDMDEPDFLVETASRSGCGVLLDVNNAYITGQNCGIDPERYIRSIPPALIGEVHIAGHRPDPGADPLLIDSHDAPVAEQVWQLLDVCLEHTGPRPVLLERDDNLPPFRELVDESKRAARLVAAACHDSRVA